MELLSSVVLNLNVASCFVPCFTVGAFVRLDALWNSTPTVHVNKKSIKFLFTYSLIHAFGWKYCAQFVSPCSLQNELRGLAKATVGVRVRFMVRINPRSEVCKLRMSDFKIAQRILQIAHTDKSSNRNFGELFMRQWRL